MADIERENRKQELRRRVVDTKDLLQQQEAEQAQEQGKRRQRRRRILVFLAVVLVLGALVAGAVYMMKRPYTGCSQNWRNSFTGENGVSESDYEDYEIFGDGFLKVTRDGATYIDSSGKTIWNQSYEMNSPYVSISGDYCAIADQGKTAIYIMNKTGTTGQAETNLPITKISVAGTGVTYALLEDSKASYITVFSKEGAALDISIKSVLDGDGYPVDIAVSPDGTELIASFASIENGTIQNKVIFYNLSEIGQNAGSNRVVGGFTDDFSGHLAGRVHFTEVQRHRVLQYEGADESGAQPEGRDRADDPGDYLCGRLHWRHHGQQRFGDLRGSVHADRVPAERPDGVLDAVPAELYELRYRSGPGPGL